MVDNVQTIISKAEEPNSFECGKAGKRFKLYFNEPKDLKKKLDELKELGLFSDTDLLN